MRIPYIFKDFRNDSLRVIAQANQIAEDFAAQGYDLTLRQLYYQFVAKDLIPNTKQSYKRLGSILNDARLAGMFDWDYMVDRTRNLEKTSHWGSPNSIIRGAAKSFRLDKWANQPNRVEIWIEKDALSGVIERPAGELDVAYFACRGYVSQSELWRAAQRHLEFEENGHEVTVLHLGDHDPSGIDMTRDIQDRLWVFGTGTTVARIALNMDQIELYQPPPNPTKLTDSRAPDYIAEYGYDSWELDALAPSVLSELVTDEVLYLRDDHLWDEEREEEKTHRKMLREAARRWDEVATFLVNN